MTERTRLRLAVLLLIASGAASATAQSASSSARPTIDSAARRDLIDNISRSLRHDYVWPDTAERMARYLGSRFQDGAYDDVSDPGKLAAALTRDLRSVYNDVHLSISYDPAQLRVRDDSTPAGRRRAEDALRVLARRQNYGVRQADILPTNIGYLRIDRFFDVDEESASTVRAAFAVIHNSSALIIDLRNNGGGSPDMVREVCNYLFQAPTHINDLFERRTNETTAYWTHPNAESKRFAAIPVYVLVGRRTFSAAEEFAYDLQSRQRATIVGERTGGGAHAVYGISVGYGLFANVPYARAINPVTKTNWEATGVRPDVTIGADSALDAAILQYCDVALRRGTDSSPCHRTP